MYLSGIGDEAGAAIGSQIRATKTLGWSHIEVRNVLVPGFPSGNIHDIPDVAFEIVVDQLQNAGIRINCFASAVGNWGKKIDQPFDSSLAEARRAIPRMQRLGTKLIRVMSFAVRDAEDQMEEERFRRMRELTKLFLDAGIQPVHENCMNYGGMGWTFMQKLLDNVPGLKVVFDTGNPIFNDDRSKLKPWPKQNSWEFYSHVKEAVAHVHVKDAAWDPQKKEAIYSYPGEGQGDVWRILKDLLGSGYEGGISIEPHLAAVFHDATVKTTEVTQFATYVEYGRRLVKMLDEIKAEMGIPKSEI